MSVDETKPVCRNCGADFKRDCKVADWNGKVYCSSCNDYVFLDDVKKEIR